MKHDILSMALDELRDLVVSLGEKRFRADQLYGWMQKGAAPGEMTNLPKAFREKIAAECEYRLPTVERRLESALDRWFGCNLAAEMGAFADLRAEVPFFIGADSAHRGIMPDEACEARLDSRVLPSAFLEGEIDLLGLSEGGRCASVVDYKTGGSADESSEKLALKHVLQAACYAYAVMEQGVERVDATFVRVERPQADDPSQPQCVRYRFEASDLPDLKQAIFDCYAAAQARG